MIDDVPHLLSLLVIFAAAPLTWFVAIRLWSISRLAPELRVLRAHAIAALALAVIVSVFAFVFLNNDLDPPPLTFVQTQYLTRGTLLVVSLSSSIYWLRLYRRTVSGS